jgi:hypothetical protein
VVNDFQAFFGNVIMKSTSPTQLSPRLSLCFLWLFTAATSIFWGRDISYEILAQQHIQGAIANWLINAGGILDAVIGLWLLTAYNLEWCYRAQILVIIVYSILLTAIDASWWLHPFGPITKNIPILALLFMLLQTTTATEDNK